jgi:hypothetical protein
LTVIPGDQAGDVSSGVYELAGDRDIPILCRYDRRQAHSFTRFHDAVADDTNSMGRLLIQVVQPFTTQIAVDGGAFQILVYMHAMPGFKLIDYIGMSTVFEVTPPASRGLKITEKSSEKITRQASVRSIATTDYPSLTPGTSKSVSGVIADETTYGPLALGKRFHPNCLRGDNPTFTAAQVVPPPLVFGSPLWMLVAPFNGWAGSLNYKAIPAPGYAGGQLWFAYRAANSLPKAASGPIAFANTTVDPTLSFTDPYLKVGQYSSIHDPNEAYENVPIAVDTWDNTLTTGYYGYVSFGDDFSVYHLTCPPVLTFVAPAERAARLKARAQPKPTSSNTTFEPTKVRYTSNDGRIDGASAGKE